MNDLKKLEIFCGTGGVGKTTLATSRALHLASKGRKVLLITIDPSLRLKQILNLNESNAGVVNEVNFDNIVLYAQLMSTEKTFEKLGINSESKNKILEILMRPNGGMNEIMAILEVHQHIKSDVYDTIVLDTPPGKHFLDFLDASKKIDKFFDNSYVEVFKFFGKNLNKNVRRVSSGRIFSKIVSSGIKKLLGYLERVTGKEFVEVFIEAIFILHQNKDYFLRSLDFQNFLKDSSNYRWFLVSSTEQSKVQEVKEITLSATHLKKENSHLLVNRCLNLDKISEQDLKTEPVQYYIERENKILEFFNCANLFKSFKQFPEIFHADPKKHVKDLCTEWEKDDPR